MRQRRPDWLIPAALMMLALVPSLAGIARLANLAVGAPVTPANARFFAAPIPVGLHLLAVIPYAFLGALQFAPALRRRRPLWHRASGMLLVVLAMVAATTGLWMTLSYEWPVGDGEALYVLRLVFGSAMAMAIVLAVGALQRRNFVAHGAWMTRGYAIAMGAGTQVLTHIPYEILVGKPGVQARAFLMSAGWVINLLVAEWIIRRAGPGGLPKPGAALAPKSDEY
jgi:uncharacterized membrane protein